MTTMASQITSLTIVYSTVYSGEDQRKHQSPVSLAFVQGIHRGPVNSPHKWPVTRKMFPFDDVIMIFPLIYPLHVSIQNCSQRVTSNPSPKPHTTTTLRHHPDTNLPGLSAFTAAGSYLNCCSMGLLRDTQNCRLRITELISFDNIYLSRHWFQGLSYFLCSLLNKCRPSFMQAVNLMRSNHTEN